MRDSSGGWAIRRTAALVRLDVFLIANELR
jgi:hypothetical protein